MLLLAYMAWERLGVDVVSSLIFGILGIGLMLLGYKAFDWITPKLDVEMELSEKHNVAVAIVIAALLIGVSILIAHIVSA
jgi:uncharacterized membrane protein YjfL (UPF0719 family)